jgi:hypothetical protein
MFSQDKYCRSTDTFCNKKNYEVITHKKTGKFMTSDSYFQIEELQNTPLFVSSLSMPLVESLGNSSEYNEISPEGSDTVISSYP